MTERVWGDVLGNSGESSGEVCQRMLGAASMFRNRDEVAPPLSAMAAATLGQPVPRILLMASSAPYFGPCSLLFAITSSAGSAFSATLPIRPRA